MNAGSADAGALAIYRQRCERLAAERDRLWARSRRVGYLRLGIFAAGALAVTWLLSADSAAQREWAAATALLLLIGFVALALYHDRVKRQHGWHDELWHINDEGVRRATHDWDAILIQDRRPAPAGHPYAADLDLFGHASVAQLLGPVGTRAGLNAVRAWLLEPAEPAVIRSRQEAVRELAPLADVRDALAVHGRMSGLASDASVARFLEWAEGEPWLLRRPWLLALVRLLPVLTVGTIVARAAGLEAAPHWLLPVFAGAVVSAMFRARTREILNRASARHGALRSSSGAFELLTRQRFRSARLLELQRVLTVDGLAAHEQVRRLERLSVLADSRLNMFHLIVQPLTLWDFHVVAALEGWQQRVGPRTRLWLDALGEAEALASLAVLAHDNPEWAFPDIAEDGTPCLEATALGHPLIARGVRVANDVSLGPPGTFLLVTGSNMSGKSTLLRAIGVGAALAQAGAPVCATRLRMPPVSVQTSMRVQDSLEQGLSHFMAELQRLKQIVAAARSAKAHGGRPVLYLLDEILQGTNTAERRIAARRIISYLLSTHAIGAVTTHDLTLTDDPELSRASRQVHFEETVHETEGSPAMTFDYTLRPGLATSVNALRLMRLIGLEGETGEKGDESGVSDNDLGKGHEMG